MPANLDAQKTLTANRSTITMVTNGVPFYQLNMMMQELYSQIVLAGIITIDFC